MEKRTSVRIPQELVETIKAQGRDEGRTWTNQVVQLVKEALAARSAK